MSGAREDPSWSPGSRSDPVCKPSTKRGRKPAKLPTAEEFHTLNPSEKLTVGRIIRNREKARQSKTQKSQLTSMKATLDSLTAENARLTALLAAKDDELLRLKSERVLGSDATPGQSREKRREQLTTTPSPFSDCFGSIVLDPDNTDNTDIVDQLLIHQEVAKTDDNKDPSNIPVPDPIPSISEHSLPLSAHYGAEPEFTLTEHSFQDALDPYPLIFTPFSATSHLHLSSSFMPDDAFTSTRTNNTTYTLPRTGSSPSGQQSFEHHHPTPPCVQLHRGMSSPPQF